MQINPYISFKGECEAAFKLYGECLGGEPGTLFRYGESPLADQVPLEWQEKVMHGSIRVGDQVLMGADVVPERYEAPRGFSLSLQIQSIAEAERIFRDLAREGEVVMPLEKTFWAARFGMLVDRFGIPWLINCEGETEAPAL
jgi:PhnB protein